MMKLVEVTGLCGCHTMAAVTQNAFGIATQADAQITRTTPKRKMKILIVYTDAD
jgi:hypothetical protein